jgi:hypothetical protein
LIQFEEKDNALLFTVRVVPRASKSEIVGSLDGALKIRLAAPPVDGAANAELIKLLSKAFGVSKSVVEILSGQTARTKQVNAEDFLKITGSGGKI